MNSDIFKGKWQQLRGQVKRRWGKLTDDELDEVDGNLDILSGKLQEKYGEQRDAVEKTLDELEKAERASRDRSGSANA